MIAKPFIERFKQSKNKAPQGNIDNNKLLRLFQISNQTSSNENAPGELTGAIFQTFSPSYIIISTNVNGSLKTEYSWANPLNSGNNLSSEITGKPASSLCEQVKHTKQLQSVSDIKQRNPNDYLLKKLSAQTYTGFPVFNENNNVTAVISLINDQSIIYSKFDLEILSSITQRIARELKPATSFDKYESTESDSSNAQLKSELEAANKSLESLSYAISHDLRAPLRSMDSFSQLLLEDFTNNLPDEAIGHLNRIRRSAKRMGEMIDDLLWLAKVTRRKLEKQKFDLSKTTNNILNEIKEKHTEYNCELHTDPLLIINADKDLIKIALQHLLNNACKFSQHKSIINISLSRFDKNGETVYKLTDNGCGFDMTYYEQLFEPFKKLHDGREYKGTGIGLATVKRIIQRHGGKVWAESEIDEGTSVFFTLGSENH